MKQLFLFLFQLASTLYVTAQPDPKRVDSIAQRFDSYLKQKREAISQDTQKQRFFSREAYDQFFNNYFTLLNYERSNFTEGNSAALSFKDNETRANITLSHKKDRSIVSIGTGLNISDKSGVLFSGRRPTAGTEFFISHSFLVRRNRLLSRFFPAYKTQGLEFFDEDRKKNYAERFHVLDSMELVHVKKNPVQARVLLANKLRLDTALQQKENLLKHAAANASPALQAELVHLYDEKIKTDNALKELDALRDENEVVKELQRTTNKIGLEKELATKGVTSFFMQWISYGAFYRRDNYATWDSTLILKERVSDQEFNKWSFSAAYNFFWQRTPAFLNFSSKHRFINAVYAGLSYALDRKNNYSDLDELAYLTSKITPNGDTSYQIYSEQKLRNISHLAFRQYFTHRVQLQTTLLLGKSQLLGINLWQAADFGRTEPIHNSHIGLVFRFLDSEKASSRVNFELFLALNDLEDVKGKGKSVWQRKEIGITAIVPFNKVFFQ